MSKSWNKITVDKAKLDNFKLQEIFGKVLLAYPAETGGMAVFTEPDEVGGQFVYYLTPKASEKCGMLMMEYGAEPCATPKSHVHLVIGDEAAFSLLSKE